jgi:hypothetical protein
VKNHVVGADDMIKYQPEYSKSACLGSCFAGRTVELQSRALYRTPADAGLQAQNMRRRTDSNVSWLGGRPVGGFGVDEAGCSLDEVEVGDIAR